MRRGWLGSLSLATGLLLLALPPALAQSVSGSEGDARAAGAAAALPAATAFPPVKNAATRDISLDAPPTAAGLATVTRLADGTESSAPASAALLASINATTGSALAGAPPQMTGPPAPLTPVANSGVYPYRAVGVVEVTYGPHSYPCTGTLIGPSTVLTAASCLWGAEGNPVWADDVKFYPGAQNGNAPFGGIEWAEGNVMQAFVDASSTETTYGTTPYGIGLVTLAQPAGTKLGWFGFQTDIDKTYTPSALTYGESGQDAAMASTKCPIDAATMSRGSATAAPCAAGPWGSPFFVVDNKGARFVTGMALVAPQDGTPLRGTARISAVTYQWITDHRK